MKPILSILLLCTLTASADVWRNAVLRNATLGVPEVTCSSLLSSNTGAFDSNGDFGSTSSRQYLWWQFTNTVSATVCSLDVSLFKVGNPTMTITAAIYTTLDDTNPAVQVGGDSDGFAATSLTTSATTNTFTWGADYPSIGNSNHVIVLKLSAAGSASDYIRIPTHAPVRLSVTVVGNTSFTKNASYNRRPYFVLRKQE